MSPELNSSFVPHNKREKNILPFSGEQNDASTALDSMYDLTEAILHDEEKSAKKALQQLWDLKKAMDEEEDTNPVDKLISFYQRKIDMLREKEQEIRKISKLSRELVDEKFRSEKRLISVKRGIGKCKSGIAVLQTKLDELKIQESELSLISSRASEKLKINNESVIQGLSSVVLPESEKVVKADSPIVNKSIASDFFEETIEAELTPEPFVEDAPFPVTKVLTKDECVISQFYVGKDENDKTKFIFNSRFFAEKLRKSIPNLLHKEVKTELLLTLRDTLNRLEKNKQENTFFERSFNELINNKRLKTILQAIANDDITEINEFSDKLQSKLLALGKNYYELLMRQMEK